MPQAQTCGIFNFNHEIQFYPFRSRLCIFTAMTKTEVQSKVDLKSLTKEELLDFCKELGLQSYRSDQVFQWLYQKGASDFEEMTNLSKGRGRTHP